MSACGFMIRPKVVKEATTEELYALLEEFKKVVDAFDWSKFKSCDFKSDRALGYRHNIDMIEQELAQREQTPN